MCRVCHSGERAIRSDRTTVAHPEVEGDRRNETMPAIQQRCC